LNGGSTVNTFHP